jgi:hypothetical protein
MIKGRFDIRTFLLIFGAALIGAAWATYNRDYVNAPYQEHEFAPLVWIIFATPFATFLGWLIARRSEGWWAAFVCFCIYFFSPFIAARYESCTVTTNSFNLANCFINTAAAQEAANSNGHEIYFQVVVVVHVLAALVVALHRSLRRSTMQQQAPLPQPEPSR